MPRDLAAIAQPATRITGLALREYLEQERIVRRGMKTPRACDELALTLWVFRQLVARHEAHYPGANTRQRFQAALSELVATIPTLRTRLGMLLTNPLMPTETIRVQLGLLETLASAVAQAREHSFEMLEPAVRERWHDLAIDLAEAFSEAMRSSNPELRLRPSNQGPVVRFLARAIPYVTGETPMEFTIARHLQRKGWGNKPA